MKLLSINAIALLLLLSTTHAFAGNLPKLVDVGADKCIPCIKMAPILDQLREDFRGQMDVVFVDVWKQREDAASYGVRMIPTQIFYAADGSELFRHTGFFSRAEILAKWQELGFKFGTRKP
ncbi:MAG: thioredoxin family protein [Desulfuromonadaceae bacterium]|nr:thioredoxin family protein [Desulfuromonadaceae bacterium]